MFYYIIVMPSVVMMNVTMHSVILNVVVMKVTMLNDTSDTIIDIEMIRYSNMTKFFIEEASC